MLVTLLDPFLCSVGETRNGPYNKDWLRLIVLFDHPKRSALMQVLRLIFLLLFLGVLALGAIFLFSPGTLDDVPVLGPWALMWQGAAPAKTPQEALERFRDLVKKRDYKHALLFCSGPYVEEVRGGAEPATALAKSSR